ncbi:hypothetical protein HPB48_022603 [Haemaphysalis longicornis]|uniref:Uncharacterized protein n=1 Tax=Haemaphysalis longicornis TaxID=44386 RepID=A0A9J6GW44_HAELO|nr:hypothetical protein HPB48_022603 [Haemaphysalis longicornis]
MEKLKCKRASRRAQNTKLINEGSAILTDTCASVDPLTSLYERLKTNNDELNKINNELESYIEDDAFQAEYNSVIDYQDHATRILTELKSRCARLSQSAAVISTGAENPILQVVAPQKKGASLPKLTTLPSTGICASGTNSGSCLIR